MAETAMAANEMELPFSSSYSVMSGKLGGKVKQAISYSEELPANMQAIIKTCQQAMACINDRSAELLGIKGLDAKSRISSMELAEGDSSAMKLSIQARYPTADEVGKTRTAFINAQELDFYAKEYEREIARGERKVFTPSKTRATAKKEAPAATNSNNLEME